MSNEHNSDNNSNNNNNDDDNNNNNSGTPKKREKHKYEDEIIEWLKAGPTPKQIEDEERRQNIQKQHMNRNKLRVFGMPTQWLTVDELRDAVMRVFNAAGADVKEEHIEWIGRRKNSQHVVCHFVDSTHRSRVLNHDSTIRQIHRGGRQTGVGFKPLFCEEYFEIHYFIIKSYREGGRVLHWKFVNDAIMVQLQGDDKRYHAVTHWNDLIKLGIVDNIDNFDNVDDADNFD